MKKTTSKGQKTFNKNHKRKCSQHKDRHINGGTKSLQNTKLSGPSNNKTTSIQNKERILRAAKEKVK